MLELINKYTDIIHLQSRLLMDSDKSYLSLSQRQAIELINRYSTHLAIFARQSHTNQQQLDKIRHELINILTPIVGYVEMLADGWIGTLNPDQSDHVDIIQQSVNMLRNVVLLNNVQTEISESA